MIVYFVASSKRCKKGVSRICREVLGQSRLEIAWEDGFENHIPQLSPRGSLNRVFGDMIARKYTRMTKRNEIIKNIQKIAADHVLRILRENPLVGRRNNIENVMSEVERTQVNVGLDRGRHRAVNEPIEPHEEEE